VPKILVADDNANIQKMVALSFEDRGVAVVAVGNGEAAVRRIPDLKPDLVLADIFMPVRNGYEVCEFVKKDERFSHVPVILLVGAFDPLDEKEARRVGADGVLKKPFVPPDPLIAMVMSALEKNPKVAAELAKAREAKEAPPPAVVESIPEPATSVRAELKPLPDFPEPTPEEAALVYGFGTGRRALDDAPLEAGRASEPKAPVAESDEAAEDEFDGASTTRDWRRNAMEIDIPPDAANKPAFATDEEPDSSLFPSERDVPPRRVPFKEQAEDTDSRAPFQVPSSAEPAPAETAETTSANALDSDFFASPERTPAAEADATRSHPAPTEPEPPVPAPEVTPSGTAHWMDQLAQGSSDRPAGDWMSLLSEQTAKDTTFSSPEAQRDDFNAPPEPLAEASESVPDMHFASDAPVTPQPVPTHQEAAKDSFFADDAAPGVPGASWFSLPEQVTQRSTETAVDPIEVTVASTPVANRNTDQSLETESEPELPIAYKDPELVEPPAVHVTPEPLLVEDESEVQSHYGVTQQQDVQPMHAFLLPASPELPGEEPPQPEPLPSAVVPAPSFETAPADVEVNERIPTGPPPNREALAQIPFLTPPADFQAQPRGQVAADPETVDAVVRKVLAKLEPQLHDLLSQGVLKPLVENLLQGELTKKEE
jgi:CheY-like chemotaxis protein